MGDDKLGVAQQNSLTRCFGERPRWMKLTMVAVAGVATIAAAGAADADPPTANGGSKRPDADKIYHLPETPEGEGADSAP